MAVRRSDATVSGPGLRPGDDIPTDRAAVNTQVYRILTTDEWARFQSAGVYEGAALDRRDGFIHLSAEDQVEGTLAAHYPARAGVVLVEIDAAALGAALRWEPSRAGALFPHLYATLPLAAVRSARSLG